MEHGRWFKHFPLRHERFFLSVKREVQTLYSFMGKFYCTYQERLNSSITAPWAIPYVPLEGLIYGLSTSLGNHQIP